MYIFTERIPNKSTFLLNVTIILKENNKYNIMYSPSESLTTPSIGHCYRQPKKTDTIVNTSTATLLSNAHLQKLLLRYHILFLKFHIANNEKKCSIS